MAAELKPVYLLSGSDRPKISRAVRRLRARLGDDGGETLSAVSAGAEDAVAACNALGLFAGEARLVLVDDVERWKAADVKVLAAYLESPAPGTVLTLVANELKHDAQLAKLCAKAGEHLRYDVTKRDLPRWIGEQFERRGVRGSREIATALLERVGEDLVELESEIDKLATWANGEPVAVRDVERIVAGRAEAPIFALTDAWGARDVARALEACDALLERSGEPRSRALPRIVGTLAGHVGRVRACQALAAEGVRPRDAAGPLKLHPYAAEKAFAHAANFSPAEVGEALVRLAELDRALKGASRLPAELELDRALIDVTRRADRPRPARAAARAR